MMADLVVRIVRDVLWHIAIKDLESSNVPCGKSRADCLAIELQIDPR